MTSDHTDTPDYGLLAGPLMLLYPEPGWDKRTAVGKAAYLVELPVLAVAVGFLYLLVALVMLVYGYNYTIDNVAEWWKTIAYKDERRMEAELDE